MLRYLRRLADRDFALDRGMIPLGSCTMKLNATTEMVAVTWPEFANLHPFAPTSQTEGIRSLVADLSAWLCEITGYDAVSLQPNAGSQGEFAGLLAIHAYHQASGEGHRRVCLIPASAHGTNAASAVMAGLKVVVVKTDAASGNVDMDDLRAKVEAHRDDLAAIMVTYPSTHGVYEDTITELCALVHEAGGQVYVDGANLNALVGLAQPGKFGADVSPPQPAQDLLHPARRRRSRRRPGRGARPPRAAPAQPPARAGGRARRPASAPISGAPYGSAGILPISWAYVRLMGGDGLTPRHRRWPSSAPTTSRPGCASTTRCSTPATTGSSPTSASSTSAASPRDTGVTVDDIAKRLVDYGFHAPTMSFPVAGTLMVEPTESEDLDELDRFCDAMIAIRARDRRGRRAARWRWPTACCAHAPHTARSTGRGVGPPVRPRRPPPSRSACTPPDKYWPPVGRIDGAYGDRHLVCSCPPPEAFED